jgi:acyl-CoA thioesterase FadM
MTYWLRFLLTVIKAFFQKKMKWDEEIDQEFRVWITEADMGVMNNARYFNFTELSKMRHFVGMGLFGTIIKLNWQPLASFQIIRYKKALKRFEKFRLRSNILYWDDKYIFQHYVFERKGQLMASVVVKACFLSPKGIVHIDEVAKILGMENMPEAPPMPQVVRDMYSAEKELLNIPLQKEYAV